jgi:hypothetical protein
VAPLRHATRRIIALTAFVALLLSSCSNAFLNINGMTLLMADQQAGAQVAGWGAWEDTAEVASSPMPGDPDGGSPFDDLDFSYVGQTDSYLYFATNYWDGDQTYIWGPIADIAADTPTFANFSKAEVPEGQRVFAGLYDDGVNAYNYSVEYYYAGDEWSSEPPSEVTYVIQSINADGSIDFSNEEVTILSSGPDLAPKYSERGDPLFSTLRDRSMDAGIFDSIDGFAGSSYYGSSWDGGRLVINEQTNELWIIDVISVRISGSNGGTEYESSVPLGFITLKASFDPGSGTFSNLEPVVFYATSARVEEYASIWSTDDYDSGVIIHDSDDGLQPRVSYAEPATGSVAVESHGESVFPDLFPVADGIDEWHQQTVIDLETFTPTYSGAPIGFHPDTGLPYTFNSGGFAMALNQQDDGTYRWILRKAGASQTDVINLFTAYSSYQAYVPWGGDSLPTINAVPFEDGWPGDDYGGDFAYLNELYGLSMHERSGYLYAFSWSYRGFAATPVSGERFPGFFRGGGPSLADPTYGLDGFSVQGDEYFVAGDYVFVIGSDGDYGSRPLTILRAPFNE